MAENHSAPGAAVRGRWIVVLALLPLAFLWFVLINHLRFEWAVNPQYSFGWAVPVLCVYLAWRAHQKAEKLKAEKLKTERLKS